MPIDNQHQHIKGYRDLSTDEIALINEAKVLSDQVGEFIAKISDHLPYPNIDPRWIAIGRTDLQKGFMALIRAIARPTTF